MDSSLLDDEHKLIAIYAQRLSQETKTVVSYINRYYYDVLFRSAISNYIYIFNLNVSGIGSTNQLV
jgi:hypothetical protein